MATFLFDGDELRECPYNSNHRVLSRRLLSHMGKCASEPGAPDLKVCPFNSMHRLYPHEFAAHTVECPDNRQAIRELLNPSGNSANTQSNNSQSEVSQDGWEAKSENTYVLQGLDEREDEEIVGNHAFIPQHHLYGLKPAERKRIYNQITEDAIRRKAQTDRENLSKEEAIELGLNVARTEFIIDNVGERTSNTEEAAGPENTEDSSGRPEERRPEEIRPTERREESADKKIIRNIKRPLDEDEDEDNKEEIKKLIARVRPDCFKSRVTRD